MREQLARLFLAWLAVTALILTAACSKGGGGGGQPAAPKAQAPKPPQIKPPQKQVAQNDQELDDDSGTPAGYRAGSEDAVPSSQIEGAPSGPAGSGGPGLRGGIQVVDYDPTGKTPDEIFGGHVSRSGVSRGGAPVAGPEGVSIVDRPNVGSRRAGSPTGTRLEGSLFYSGSGQDSLYEQLKQIADADGNAHANHLFASQIGYSTFEIDWKTRSARLVINIEKDGMPKARHAFVSALDKKLHFKAGSLARAPYIEAEAVCMDLGGGCNTVHARLKQKTANGIRVAHVIIRHTDAWLFSEGEDESTGNNDDYNRFIHIMKTSAYYPGGANSITAKYFNTSETINGPSYFAFSMQMNVSVLDPSVAQAITWTGPLVKSVETDELDVPIEQYADYNPWGRPQTGAPQIANAIASSRLVRNNGRGSIQIDVTFAKLNAAAREQTARLTIARIHEPTRDIVLR